MSATGIGPRLVLWWAALYTRGLEQVLREDRRDEIASDVFEQCADGQDRRGTTLSLLGRCLLGVPADLSWRLEHSRSAGLPVQILGSLLGRCERTARWVGRHGLPKVTPAVAVLYALLGVLLFTILAAGSTEDPGGVTVIGTWCVLAATAMVAGWRRMDRHRTQGLALVVVGAAPLGLLLVVTVVAPVAAGMVVWTEGRRWRQLGKAHA